MEFISVLNDVLGPVMHGPSSSHTAGSYHIGRTARSLLGDEPRTASFTFDPDGSYARTYRQQGVDLALAAGLMGWPITDRRFLKALEFAKRSGLKLVFEIAPLVRADHPNMARIRMTSANGGTLEITAKSTGGGGFVIAELEGRPVEIKGKSHETVVLAGRGAEAAVKRIMAASGRSTEATFRRAKGREVLLGRAS